MRIEMTYVEINTESLDVDLAMWCKRNTIDAEQSLGVRIILC